MHTSLFRFFRPLIEQVLKVEPLDNHPAVIPDLFRHTLEVHGVQCRQFP
jgi:hypothetical protein